MTLAADRALVARDRALPGLGLVLDGDALAQELDRRLDRVDVQGARATYVRYKPATSCLVGYALLVDGEQHLVVARAQRAGDEAKAAKAVRKARAPSLLGADALLLDDLVVSVVAAADDRELPALATLLDDGRRSALLQRALPSRPLLWDGALRPLRHKPERRFVATLDGGARARAVVKVHSADAYPAARAACEPFGARGVLRVPERIGGSARHRVAIYGWLDGARLDELLADPRRGGDAVAAAGSALAELHAHRSDLLATRAVADERDALHAAARAAAVAGTAAGARARRIAETLVAGRGRPAAGAVALHGDFSADQVLVGDGTVGLVDLDDARRGDPLCDLASFVADLELRAVCGELDAGHAAALTDRLLDAYAAQTRRRPDLGAFAERTAAAVLRRAAEPFRARHPDWPDRVEAMLERAAQLGGAGRPAARQRRSRLADLAEQRLAGSERERLGVRQGRLALRGAWPDREGGLVLEYESADGTIVAGRDDGRSRQPALLPSGSDPRLPGLAATCARPGARIVGHRAGKRAVVALPDRFVKLVRPRRTAVVAAAAARAAPLARDGLLVPELVAVDERLGLVAFAPLAGSPLTDLLAARDGPAAARAVGEALRALHESGLPEGLRCHDADAEASLLIGWTADVAPFAADVAVAAGRLAIEIGARLAALPVPVAAPIHRDLHDGQLLLAAAGTVGLLDFDTLAAGDPALDVGNLLAHLRLRALQGRCSTERARAARAALLDGYGVDGDLPARLAVYEAATLARLACVYALRPRWAPLVGALLELASAEPSGVAI